MTAIQPALLKAQASQLALNYNNPAIFIRQLHELLDHYGRHVYRTGKTSIPTTILPSYKVPQPVLRQIELELVPYLGDHCEVSMALCDALWQEEVFEFKLLAATIIGKIPVDDPEMIIKRIYTWTLEVKDRTLTETLFKKGFEYSINKDANSLISRASNWLNNSQLSKKSFGLQLILATLENQGFENLPQVFRLVAPFVREAPLALRSLIVQILQKLIERSPNETAYFLLQNIALSFDKDTAWFIRRCLRMFPPDIQDKLQDAIRIKESNP